MKRHHVEVFTTGPDAFGWQCFTCTEEFIWCRSLAAAEIGACAHQDKNE